MSVRSLKNFILTATSALEFIDLSTLIKVVALLLVILVTVAVRLRPLKYGAYIGEFDPNSYFACTKYIVNHVEAKGIPGLLDFFSWHETRTWYPFGVDMAKSYHPVHPFLGAFVYFTLRLLGFNFTLEMVGIYLPIAMAVIAILFTYLIGKEIGGEMMGILAALMLSVSTSYVLRSNLGWYDTEMVGVPTMLAGVYFYIKTLRGKESFRRRLIYSVLSGFSVGLMMGSWGASKYLLGMIALSGMVLTFLGEVPERFEATHAITLTLSIILTLIMPTYGVGFIKDPLALFSYLSMAYAYLAESLNLTYKRISKLGGFQAFSLTILAALIAGASLYVVYSRIGGRSLAIINPFYKPEEPLLASVQEHAGSSFMSIFLDLNILIPFCVYGSYLLVKDRDPEKITLLLFTLSSVYSMGSFVRLIVLASPFVALTAIYGFKELFDGLLKKLLVKNKKRKFAVKAEFKPIVSLSLIAIVACLPFSPYLSLISPTKPTDTPVTIASASLPFQRRIDVWIEALEWIRENTPKNAVIAAWWDYGYWLSFIANRTTLADNGTMNGTRIRELATMFMSNETVALKILKRLNADYVLIFITSFCYNRQYYTLAGYGEGGKFIQMVRIGRFNESDFISRSMGHTRYKDRFWESFLGKLIPYNYSRTDQNGYDWYVRLDKYPSGNYSAPLTLAYDAKTPIIYYSNPSRQILIELIPEVLIYKVNKA